MIKECVEECVVDISQKLYEKDSEITTFSVDDKNIIDKVEKPFRCRYLTDLNEVFSYNAWDDVEWSEEQEKIAIEKIHKQMLNPVIDKEKYMNNPSFFWDKFYENHKTHFFKNRKWLFHEFPQIFDCICSYSGKKYILEIGCGVGNTMFPILLQNKNPFLVIHGVDYSKKAIEIVKGSELFSGDNIRASVWDMANLNGEFPEGATNVDIVILIFAFSSLSPSQWNIAVQNIYKMLKPGGIILFRDYGRWDMTQLRFKKERFLDNNFYIRGDGTRVYFFSHGAFSVFFILELISILEHIPEIFGKLFKIERNEIDKRLLVNRATMQKMYRVWIHGVFKKI